MLGVASGECEQAMRDLIVRKIGEIVVIFVDFDDLVQTAALEGQGFGEHLIDGGAANDREMAEIVVIGLKQEGFLLNLIGQLDESQQMMLRKLAAAVVVDVDASNAVTVEGGGAVFALKLAAGGCFNIRGGVFFGGREETGASECAAA